MEKHQTPLAQLTSDSKRTCTKVVIKEKGSVRTTPRSTYQRYVIADSEGTQMQCIAFGNDVPCIDTALLLYHTYFLGFGRVRKINPAWPPMVDCKYEMVLHAGCYINEARDSDLISLDGTYGLTQFNQFQDLLDIPRNQMNILAAVVEVLDYRVTKSDRRLQEFTIVDHNKMPFTLTLWDDFFQFEVPKLIQEVHTFPVILMTRVSVSSFNGISISTTPTSMILFDPPISEAQRLKDWIKNNRHCVEEIISRKPEEKKRQSIQCPTPAHVRKISQVLSAGNAIKTFWAKATIQIIDDPDGLCIMICPVCKKNCGAYYGSELKCLHCQKNYSSPEAKLRFKVNLTDETGFLEASVESERAEDIIKVHAEHVAKVESEGGRFDIEPINCELAASKSFCHVKTYSYVREGTFIVRYVLMSWVQSSEQTSSIDKSLHSGSKRPAEISPDNEGQYSSTKDSETEGECSSTKIARID